MSDLSFLSTDKYLLKPLFLRSLSFSIPVFLLALFSFLFAKKNTNTSLLYLTASLSLSCSVIAALSLRKSKRVSWWFEDLFVFLPALFFMFFFSVLFGTAEWLLCLAWYFLLFLAGISLAEVLQRLKVSAPWRVFVIGFISAFLCSSVFWASLVFSSFTQASKTLLVQWLMRLNPLATGIYEVCGLSILESHFLYMQGVSDFTEIKSIQSLGGFWWMSIIALTLFTLATSLRLIHDKTGQNHESSS